MTMTLAACGVWQSARAAYLADPACGDRPAMIHDGRWFPGEIPKFPGD
jgi:hypothetical protein